MKQHLAVFLGQPINADEWRKNMTPENQKKMQEGMQAWSDWAKKYQSVIVQTGSPLGKTKRVDKKGISDIRNEMGAWCVVQAESHEEAAKIFEGHPHFTIFPGERVEVMECLPIPKM